MLMIMMIIIIVPLEMPGVDERTILEWILKKYESIRGIGFVRLRIGIIGEPLQMLPEPPGPMNHGVS